MSSNILFIYLFYFIPFNFLFILNKIYSLFILTKVFATSELNKYQTRLLADPSLFNTISSNNEGWNKLKKKEKLEKLFQKLFQLFQLCIGGKEKRNFDNRSAHHNQEW